MTKKFAKLYRIEHNEVITKETNDKFIYHLECAMLLALREQGRLNAVQHRYAEEKLKQQHLNRAKMISEKGERR